MCIILNINYWCPLWKRKPQNKNISVKQEITKSLIEDKYGQKEKESAAEYTWRMEREVIFPCQEAGCVC